jgi:hypothetical protein
VAGADGGISVVLGDRTYWLFGDTLLLPESGRQIEPNTVAWSVTADPDGCPKLNHHTGADGEAVPFLAKDGALTVWPSGAWPVDEHHFDVYTTYVYGTGPYAYWIGEVGLTRVDVRTMEAEVLSRSLWDAESGFGSTVVGVQPVDADDEGRLRVVLETQAGERLLARVRERSLHEAEAYEYWDGGGWRESPGDAATLWAPPVATSDVQRLAAYDAGGSIAYHDGLGQYVALVNTGFAGIGVRTAPRLEGPWSEPRQWLDCTTIAGAAVPVCYSPLQHPQLSQDGSIIATITRMSTYDTVLIEFTMNAP